MALFDPKKILQPLEKAKQDPATSLMMSDLASSGLNESQVQELERLRADVAAAKNAAANLASDNRVNVLYDTGLRRQADLFERAKHDPRSLDALRNSGYSKVVDAYNNWKTLEEKLQSTATNYANVLNAPKAAPEVRPSFFVEAGERKAVGPSGSMITRQGPSMTDFLRANQERYASIRENSDVNKGLYSKDKSLRGGEAALDKALFQQSGWNIKADDGGATNFKKSLGGQQVNFRVAKPLESRFANYGRASMVDTVAKPSVPNAAPNPALPGTGRPLTPAELDKQKRGVPLPWVVRSVY